jgi:peptidyl-prolyl cis-trans isomerase A (cyclophilin A)
MLCTGAMKAMVPVLLGALALQACAKKDAPAPAPSASASASAAPTVVKAGGPLASTLHPDLLDPSKAKARAPDVFKAHFTTSKGDFVIEVHRDWAPIGADRFYNLVKLGFYDDTRFFRVIDRFLCQFGISGDPAVSAKWANQTMPDDPVVQSNKRGYVSFGQTNAPNSRTTQIIIDTGDNPKLDAAKFAPFGLVTSGLDVVDSLYSGYGEGDPAGKGPNQVIVQARGNAFADKLYPQLDAVRTAIIVP